MGALGPIWTALRHDLPPGSLEPRLPRAEHRRAAVAFGEQVLLKMYRRLGEGVSPELELNRKDFDFATRNLKKMFDGGVRIAFGTDAGNGPPRFEGYFDHLEMQLMVRYGGMTPMQVIQAFSKTNSEVLGIDKDYGTLAKGKAADLLVLAKNPLEDIMNTETLRTVYIGGNKFE